MKKKSRQKISSFAWIFKWTFIPKDAILTEWKK